MFFLEEQAVSFMFVRMTSLPAAFIERIKLQFPDQAEEMIASFDRAANSSGHLNPHKANDLWKDEVQVPWFEGGRILKIRPSFTLDPLYHAGCYYPQESSSMILFHVLNSLFPNNRNVQCLDLCASPGGKSLIISEFLGKEGRLISNEVIRLRNSILRENLIKWGTNNVVVTCNDAKVFGEMSGYFDCVLVDAPCSGEGMFRKDVEARGEWSEGNVLMCSNRQKNILSDVAPSIKKGGYLIYSTCTFSEEENESNCLELLASGLFEAVRIETPVDWNIETITEHDLFALRFLPHKMPGEGFFIAVYRKICDEPNAVLRGKSIFEDASKKEKDNVLQFLKGEFNLIKNKEGDLFASPFSSKELNGLAQFLYVTMPGVELGRIIRDEFIPAHALALSGFDLAHLPVYALERDEALNYLRGDPVFKESSIGWKIATFENHPLGWVKVMKNRVNNYYPKEYRIRMR